MNKKPITRTMINPTKPKYELARDTFIVMLLIAVLVFSLLDDTIDLTVRKWLIFSFTLVTLIIFGRGLYESKFLYLNVLGVGVGKRRKSSNRY